MQFRILLSLGAVGAIVLAAAACGGGEASGEKPTTLAAVPATAVTVKLSNWHVSASADTLAAGTVRITAVHDENHGHGAPEGGAVHQLMVAPLAAGEKAGAHKYGAPVLNLTDLKPGESREASVALTPGTYEFACLVVEDVDGKQVAHYEKGMYAAVTVK
jgi:uncharacterized cupredoxin-like copper-binding protein